MRSLESLAAINGLPVAELIRRAIDLFLQTVNGQAEWEEKEKRNATLLDPFHVRVQQFFGAVTRKERLAVQSMINKIMEWKIGGNGRNWLYQNNEAEVAANLERVWNWFESGRWRSLTIGSKSTPILHQMAERKAQKNRKGK